MFLLFVLFVALGAVLALLTWGELTSARRAARRPAPSPRAAAPDDTADDTPEDAARSDEDGEEPPEGVSHDAVLARVAAELAPQDPAPEEDSPDPDAALPHVRGFAPGVLLELELDGPAPAAAAIRFEQVGGDVRVLIEDTPVLLIEDTLAAELSPETFRFRSSD